MTQIYQRRIELPVSAEEAFRWHERPGALQRLVPPWESVEVEQASEGVSDGARVILVTRLGPLRLRWVADHDAYEFGRQFRDTQTSGPFKYWQHTHRFEPLATDRCALEDHVEYELPGGPVGRLLGGRFIFHTIDRMFRYRHATTLADLTAHARLADRPPLRVAVTGASGLIGSVLCPLLTTGGHQVTRLVRRSAGPNEVAWNPHEPRWDSPELESVNAVVHLAGMNIAARRWSRSFKKAIRDSRLPVTRKLCEALVRGKQPPQTLVVASATGYYGDRGSEVLTEQSPVGSGFLSEVCFDWETAAQPAIDAGIRVVHVRFGIVLSPRGGALAKMLLPFRCGVGGKVGSGDQWWSWISIDDAAGAVHHALLHDQCTGPVNAVTPEPVTNTQFTQELARVLHRPAVVPMPSSAARLVLGEMADALLLASTRVEPRRLQESGYRFRHPTLDTALRHVLGR